MEISDAVKGQRGCVATCLIACACGEIASWVDAIVGSKENEEITTEDGAKATIPKKVVYICTTGESGMRRDDR